MSTEQWQEIEKIKRQQIKETEKLKQQREEAEQARLQAADFLKEMFLDVEQNEPSIQKAPNHEVSVIELRDKVTCQDQYVVQLAWGNKLELSNEENQFLQRIRYKLNELKSEEVPQEIIKRDCFVIVSMVVEDRILVWSEENVFEIHSFLANPGIVYSIIAKALLNPTRFISVLRKGNDYWKESPETHKIYAFLKKEKERLIKD